MLNNKGLTLVEITITAGILLILTSIIALIIKPNEYKAKARDTTRIQNISKLYEAFIEYKIKNGVYPGNPTQLYKSDTGNLANLTSAFGGWIDSDISDFLQLQYIDPVNMDALVFEYKNNGDDFELNAVLEEKKDTMQLDRGNNITKFEMGTDLEILP